MIRLAPAIVALLWAASPVLALAEESAPPWVDPPPRGKVQPAELPSAIATLPTAPLPGEPLAPPEAPVALEPSAWSARTASIDPTPSHVVPPVLRRMTAPAGQSEGVRGNGSATRRRPTQPQEPASLTIINGRDLAVSDVAVTAEGGGSVHSGPLEPNRKAVVKLPRRTGCRIAVTSINEAEGASERLELDACKVRVVRLVN